MTTTQNNIFKRTHRGYTLIDPCWSLSRVWPSGKNEKQAQGFTLIELLVVIAIIAILSVVVVLTMNPAEMLRQSRDSNRVSDLSTIRTAISLSLTNGNFNLASSYAACYLSTPTGIGTSTAKCGVFTSAGITSNASSSAVNYRKINATGWIPIDFTQLAGGTPFGSLPIDPTNNAGYYYAYAANTTGLYETGAFLESKKYTTGSTSIVTTSTIYESGSTLTL
jgi:prepilin-type N-terminal cleavage/methylation domain-containing protein